MHQEWRYVSGLELTQILRRVELAPIEPGPVFESLNTNEIVPAPQTSSWRSSRPLEWPLERLRAQPTKTQLP